ILFGGGDIYSPSYGDTWELHSRGGACSTGAQCDTGFCVDGACCERPSCGVCEACNLPASPGTCSVVTTGDSIGCTGINTCSATGECKSKNGVPCSQGSTCASGICASGVCCATVCGTGCTACNQVPAGTCVTAS